MFDKVEGRKCVFIKVTRLVVLQRENERMF